LTDELLTILPKNKACPSWALLLESTADVPGDTTAPDDCTGAELSWAVLAPAVEAVIGDCGMLLKPLALAATLASPCPSAVVDSADDATLVCVLGDAPADPAAVVALTP
jgi:hypothetical protein